MIFTPIEGKFYFNKRHYRGYFKIVSNKGKIELINVLKMEEYLYGVLKKEVTITSSSFSIFMRVQKSRNGKKELDTELIGIDKRKIWKSQIL